MVEGIEPPEVLETTRAAKGVRSLPLLRVVHGQDYRWTRGSPPTPRKGQGPRLLRHGKRPSDHHREAGRPRSRPREAGPISLLYIPTPARQGTPDGRHKPGRHNRSGSRRVDADSTRK